MKTRELKFRVWDEKEYCWDYNMLICYPYQSLLYQGRILQQFTGMTDRNGKDIYEGDIIKVHHFEDWGDTIGYDLNVVVFYHNKIGAFRSGTKCVLDNQILGARGLELNSDCEVIGNIFENPELLK